MPSVPSLWLRPGLFVLGTARYLLEILTLLYQSCSSVIWEGRRGGKLAGRVTLQQVYFTAVQSLALTILVAIAIGSLLMHQSSVLLPHYGLSDYAESLTVLILFREIAPMTVALIIIARSANAIVIELGNMRVNGEIRALEVLGINIDRYIILPRILGMTFSVVALTVCFCAAALWGGFAVAKNAGLLESDFLVTSLHKHFTWAVLSNILLRAMCFGVVIALVACHHGLAVKVSPTEVPQQASRGIVRCLSLCFVINFVISLYVK